MEDKTTGENSEISTGILTDENETKNISEEISEVSMNTKIEESNANETEYKSKKRDKRNWVIALLIALLLYNQFVVTRKIEEIEWHLNSISANVGGVYSELGSLHWRIMDAIESQMRLINSEAVEFGPMNLSDNTTEITVTVSLKEYNDDTTVSISSGDEEIPMVKNGTEFTAKMQVSVFEAFQPKLTIDDGQTIKTESLETYINLPEEYLLNVNGHTMGGWSYTNGSDVIDVDMELEVTVNETPYSRIKKASFIATANDEVILELPLENSAFQTAKIKEQLLLPNTQSPLPVHGYIKVIDSNDLEYYYFVDYFFAGEMTDEEYYNFINNRYFTLSITDSNGNVLFEPEYYPY